VQQRVVDSSPPLRRGGARADTGDESFVLAVEGSDDEDVDDDGYWWLLVAVVQWRLTQRSG
jgi:hypothetical protein